CRVCWIAERHAVQVRVGLAVPVLVDTGKWAIEKLCWLVEVLLLRQSFRRSIELRRHAQDRGGFFQRTDNALRRGGMLRFPFFRHRHRAARVLIPQLLGLHPNLARAALNRALVKRLWADKAIDAFHS